VRLFAGIVTRMVARSRTIIRRFDGSLVDAEGLLAVERSSFDECPYDAEELRVMLTQGTQRAWLAIADGSVVGFVIGFPTRGLQGLRWEIDLLAVLPKWRGRGLATRLIRAASGYGMGVARQARAAVATDNRSSERAFHRAGFQSEPEVCDLLTYRTDGLVPGRGVPLQHDLSPEVTVREGASVADAREWLSNLPALDDQADVCLLLAEQDGQPAGHAELIQVQTLLYRGIWIESLQAPARTAREALVHKAVSYASVASLDEIGAMVPSREWTFRDALLARGFRSLGEFRWLVARLPLPGVAASQPSADIIQQS
jgi:ribosomal protein S18 acetylase RimI-like enzyme